MTDATADAKAKADAEAKEKADAEAKAKAEDAAKAKADAEAKIIKNGDGSPVLDFADYTAATDQAKAIGKGATVEHIGTAFHVETKG